MLVALITILFLGGGIEDAVLDYTGYIRESVGEVVSDDERRAVARATLKEMEKLTKDYSKANQRTFKSLLNLMADMETEDGAVEEIWDEYSRNIDAYNGQMIDLRFKLRDSLSREEWDELFASSAD